MADDVTMTAADPTAGQDRDFLESAVKALVDEPDAVVVTRKVDDLGVLITLQVAPGDMKKIIGKSGQTVKSLRQLLRVVGAKHGDRVNLKVLEPDGSEYRSDRLERAPRQDAPAGEAGADASSAFDNF